MNPLFSLSVILFLYLNAIAVASSDQPYSQPLFISCGLTKSTFGSSSPDTREWQSDDDASFAPPDLNSISNTTTTTTSDANPPYNTARVFRTQLSYRFFLKPGPKFIRLYFTPFTTYNNITPSQYFVSLQANHAILLKNFSPSLNSLNKDKMCYEFLLTVEEGSEKNLNLTFSAGDIVPNNSNSNSYGVINGIEIVPVPEGLYISNNPTGTPPPKYLTNPSVGYSFPNLTALQNVYRLNVGGFNVEAVNDAGNMWRQWFFDQEYLAPGGFQGEEGGLLDNTLSINYTKITPEYVAPPLVYSTQRVMGFFPYEVNMKRNITWRFEVDHGFDYLMRLHFCEMNTNITRSFQREFVAYINSQKADELDSFGLAGGSGVPFYRDYIIRVDEGANTVDNATKVPLWLSLLPLRAQIADVLLNGLEIFRLGEIDGKSTISLAAPNPPQPPSTPIAISAARPQTVLAQAFDI